MRRCPLIVSRSLVILFLYSVALSAARGEVVVDFEDLTLGAESFYNGADGAGGFTSRGAFFRNTFTDFGTFTTWDGWSTSNITDVTTPGFTNQYSAYNLPGAGGDGSPNYAVAFGDPSLPGPEITLPAGHTIQSMKITNTTYAALAMRDGSAFSKTFGGDSGDDPDFFRLTITGWTGGVDATHVGEVIFYLADFRFTDNTQDYILDSWTSVDLSGLAGADTISFALESSDVGDFGMNTPAYFALDNIALVSVPEPSSLVLAVLALVMCIGWRRGWWFVEMV